VGGQNQVSAALTPGRKGPVAPEQEVGWAAEAVRTFRKWHKSKDNKMVSGFSQTQQYAVMLFCLHCKLLSIDHHQTNPTKLRI